MTLVMILVYASKILWLGTTLFVTSFAALTGFDEVLSNPGGTVVLYCEQSPPGNALTWTRNGAQLNNKTGKYYLSPFNSTLTIYNVGETDLGLYQCAENMNSPVQVQLNSIPFISGIQRPPNILTEGDTLHLTCETWGLPVPSCVWLRGNAILTTADPGVSFNDTLSATNMTIANAQLTIVHMNRSDQMDYTCSANNAEGTSRNSAYIRVKDRLAALWPFIGIVIVVVLTIVIIIVVERKRKYDSKLHPQ